MKGNKGSGRDNGLGVLTMATACIVSANLEVEAVRSVARRRGINKSCGEYNPFDVYSPSEQLCPEKASLSDWNQWCRHLVEIHSSVLRGNNMRDLRKSHQFPNWTLTNAKPWTVTMLDLSLSDLFPFQLAHRIKPSGAWEKPTVHANLGLAPHQHVATAVPTIGDNFGKATDARLVVVDSGATETVGRGAAVCSRQFKGSCLTQRWKSPWKQDEH